MPRYSALCCYFGQWPTHFQQWLTTCRYNQDIRFFLVSDIPVDKYEVPDNVQVINKSFSELRALIASKFSDIRISLDRPYKLCDFKTAYGYIFDDLFQGYDYWGYYDIDTFWGDIKHFIPNNDDAHLVKIFPCGHLSFIKNAAPWNKIFELVNRVSGSPCKNNMQGNVVATWQDCFSSADSHFYDEEGGLEPMMLSISAPRYLGTDFDNLLPPWRFDHFKSINFPDKSRFLTYSYEEGHLFRCFLRGLKVCKDEISYAHASKRVFSIDCIHTADKFVIYPNRIVQWSEPTLFFMLIHGRYRYISNYCRKIQRRIFRK